ALVSARAAGRARAGGTGCDRERAGGARRAGADVSRDRARLALARAPRRCRVRDVATDALDAAEPRRALAVDGARGAGRLDGEELGAAPIGSAPSSSPSRR